MHAKYGPNKLLRVIWSLSILLAASVSCSDDKQHNIKQPIASNIIKCDTMTKNIFFATASHIKEEMEGHIKLSLDKAMMVVKVYNTLHIADVVNDSKDKQFVIEYKTLFEKEYRKEAIRLLECSFGKGMTIYSKKYDLYVGIASEFRCKDVYTISN